LCFEQEILKYLPHNLEAVEWLRDANLKKKGKIQVDTVLDGKLQGGEERSEFNLLLSSNVLAAVDELLPRLPRDWNFANEGLLTRKGECQPREPFSMKVINGFRPSPSPTARAIASW